MNIILFSVGILLIVDLFLTLFILWLKKEKSIQCAIYYEILHLLFPVWLPLSLMLIFGTYLPTDNQKIILLLITAAILLLTWFNMGRHIDFILFVHELGYKTAKGEEGAFEQAVEEE